MNEVSKAVLVIDMPDNCYKCNFLISRGSFENNFCAVKMKYVNSLAEYIRPRECPLKELPDEIHNDLYLDEYADGYDDGWNTFRCEF